MASLHSASATQRASVAIVALDAAAVGAAAVVGALVARGAAAADFVVYLA